MSKFCPITGGKVVYLVCQECEDRVCEKSQVMILPKKEKPVNDIENHKEDVLEAVQKPQNVQYAHKASHPNCETCCHKCGERRETMFGKTFNAVMCKIFHNHIFTSEMVSTNGCAYYNVDVSQKEICLNCEHYLGGGDWGLACSADYNKLPTATSPACEDFCWKSKE